MIECDRCKKEIAINETLVEAVQVEVTSENFTEYLSESYVLRYCDKCWDEIIEFLLAEGKL